MDVNVLCGGMSKPSNNSRFSEADLGTSAADPWVARQVGAPIDGLSAAELEAAYQRARQMLAADLLDPAQAVLEALLLLQPQSVRVVRALGITYLRRQQVRQARAMLHYGLSIDAHDPVLHLLHGECVLLCGERSRGIQLLEHALATFAARSDAHAYMIRAQKCLSMARQAAP